MEIIFATAFGRVMDMQRKSNPLVEASFTIFNSSEGSFDETILFIFLCKFRYSHGMSDSNCINHSQ